MAAEDQRSRRGDLASGVRGQRLGECASFIGLRTTHSAPTHPKVERGVSFPGRGDLAETVGADVQVRVTELTPSGQGAVTGASPSNGIEAKRARRTTGSSGRCRL